MPVVSVELLTEVSDASVELSTEISGWLPSVVADVSVELSTA